ncbi:MULTISPECIES: hypothetical protein [unclassified Moorena]|nr:MULTISPECIES: hypothetical protein [unclassified Moorena]
MVSYSACRVSANALRARYANSERPFATLPEQFMPIAHATPNSF